MDVLLARRLENDEEYRKKITKLVKDYITLGRDSADYWASDFDTAYDILMCYAPLKREDYSMLERGHPKRFILPLSATQITTMTTFIAQVLFGQDTPHKVEGRGPEDEIPAEYVNQLLRWNSEQQATYLLGYLWVQDCLVANRGIFYNSWAPVYSSQVVAEQIPDPESIPDELTGEQAMLTRVRRKNVVVGGFCRHELVSPYDWICDPALPLWRLQEMRFCGHRSLISWQELKRRSALSLDDPAYVSPYAVEKLREKSVKPGLTDITAGTGGVNGKGPLVSRTAEERARSANPTNRDKANKQDPGMVEVYELWVRLVPSDNEIYEDGSGSEPVVFQILMANQDCILAMNESTYAHGMYPYSVGEARPFGHGQFSPSWLMMLKGIQDYVDWLKNRHQEALSRTVGNVFIADPSRVDFDDFMNPEKEGLLITLKPEAQGSKISEVIQQVPIKDMTERFHEEMMDFSRFSESITGANSAMQGQIEEEPSATQFAGTQQMSAGRMTSIARLLSSQALTDQTRQFVSNFQQFMDIPQAVRFVSDRIDLPTQLAGLKSIVIDKNTIQGRFDFVAHDGTLPGTDSKKVAAIARTLEAATMFPDMFVPAPGNLDPRKLIFAAAKASGMNVENFRYDPQSIPVGPSPMPMGGGPPAGPVGMIPPPASVGAPGPKPAEPAAPALPPVSLPSAAPPQIRPSQI